jgi:Phage integrase, N-terminal SAM-like domain
VTYDWRPTATRSATADPSIVVPRPRQAGTAAPPRDAITVSAAIDEFVESAEAGRALNRSGRPYKPSALRDLRGILEYHVAQDLGDLPLRDVRREHVQALVDRLGADGLSESRIRSVISALRALYGYAIERAHVEFNPADGLVMPQADEPAPAGERDATSTWSDRLGEPWQNQPRWEDQPRRRDDPLREDEHRREGERLQEDEPVREARTPSARGKPARDRETYRPMALLPERILSLAMRAVFVLFVLIALVSVFESL